MNDIEKWKKAIVHIEGAVDSNNPSLEAWELYTEGRLTREEWLRISRSQVTRDARFQGTGIFIIYDGKYYLATARHVLYDKTGADRAIEVANNAYKRNPTSESLARLNREIQNAEHFIFNVVFRVPLYSDEGPKLHPWWEAIILNINPGNNDPRIYAYSAPDLDLAVLSLNDIVTDKFKNNLLETGYEPIDISEIEIDSPREGGDIMAVGYPYATAIVERVSLSDWEYLLSSDHISVPIISFGKVAMYTNSLNYFWADLSIYPGNSGGAVVHNNKLVGIVSRQAVINLDEDKTLTTRIPFAYVIKSKYIIDLLNVLKQKGK